MLNTHLSDLREIPLHWALLLDWRVLLGSFPQYRTKFIMGLLTDRLPWAGFGFFLLYLTLRIVDCIALSQLKRKHGCAEPQKYPHKDPILGLDLFIATGNATKSSSLLSFNSRLFDTYGKTFQYNSWGRTAIRTMQPENIQAVLSTSFWNFGVVPIKAKRQRMTSQGRATYWCPRGF